MTVDDEMFVARLLVLTHARLEQRRVLQAGKPIREVVARNLERRGAGATIAIGRVERRPARVVCDLEAAPLVPGDAVHEARPVIRPHGHRLLRETPVARWRAE